MSSKYKTKTNYFEMGRSRGFQWVGDDLPSHCTYPTHWRCREGHTVEASYKAIRMWFRCPECYRIGGSHKPRLTERDYINLAASLNMKWLDERIPKTSGAPSTWECVKGHLWTESYQNIKMGHACPTCYGSHYIPDMDYAELARSLNLEWIGITAPSTSRGRTRWRCAVGHEWIASYSGMKNNPRCRVCEATPKTNSRFLKENDYIELAATKNFTWTGAFPATGMLPTLWMCSNAHQFEASYRRVKRLSLCPECKKQKAGMASRRTEEDYHALAARFNFRWIGNKLPAHTGKMTLWICASGHQWESSYQDLKARKGGCLHCKNPKQVKTSSDYIELAASKGYRWVGESAPMCPKSNTIWECGSQHRWVSSYARLSECPFCAFEQEEKDRRHLG